MRRGLPKPDSRNKPVRGWKYGVLLRSTLLTDLYPGAA